MQEKDKKPEESKKVFKRVVFFLFMIGTIFYIIMMLNPYKPKYHSFVLKNITCRIPNEMYDVENDEMVVNDRMFYVINKENDYEIYGLQLELLDSIDKINTPFSDRRLFQSLDFDTAEKLCDSISECSDLLVTVTDIAKIEKPSHVMYGISGEAGNGYDGFYTYIVTYCGHDVKFIEVLLYKNPELLSNKTKKDLLTHLVFDYEKDYWGIKDLKNNRFRE